MQLNKEKINNHQVFSLVADYTLGTTILSVISGVAEYAAQDAWIVALITPFMGFPFLLLYFYMAKLFPGKTLVEILQDVFGKWLGGVLSAYIVFLVCFLNVSQIVFYIGNFMRTEYMTETPLYAFNTFLVIAIVVGLMYGLECIARTSEIFFYIINFLVLLVIILDIPNIKFENLFPVAENGMVPILKGCLYLNSYMAWPLIIFMMFCPLNVADIQKNRKSFYHGYFWASFLNFLCTIMSIMILGAAITAQTNYPTYLISQEINVSVITRVEGVVTFSWMCTEFIKVSVYFYAGLVGLKQLFGLNDYKKLIIPISLVLLIFSGVVYPNAQYQNRWDSTVWSLVIGSIATVFPISIIVVKKIKDAVQHFQAMKINEKESYEYIQSLLYLGLAALIIILSFLFMKFLLL